VSFLLIMWGKNNKQAVHLTLLALWISLTAFAASIIPATTFFQIISARTLQWHSLFWPKICWLLCFNFPTQNCHLTQPLYQCHSHHCTHLLLHNLIAFFPLRCNTCLHLVMQLDVRVLFPWHCQPALLLAHATHIDCCSSFFFLHSLIVAYSPGKQ